VSDPSQAEVFVTVRAAEEARNFSANLRAPIIISGGRGFQVINEADDAPVRAPLFAQPVG
jgi:flagellar assembly factor FliW